MARLMCVATHHKAGTVWMRRVFKVIGRRLDIPWVGVWSERDEQKIPAQGRCIVFNGHGRFPQAVWQSDDAAFFHLIRDPRDVLISGAHYHLDAAEAGEKWLHKPRRDLGGVSYQQHLNALPSYEARLLFEMTHKHADTLAEMRAWPADDPRTVEARYETLMQRENAHHFRKALRHLGLADDEIMIGMKVYWTHSVFGRLFKTPLVPDGVKRHIRSAATQRFATEMPRSVGEAYAAHFNQDLIDLGYASSHDWVTTLPTRVDTQQRGTG